MSRFEKKLTKLVLALVLLNVVVYMYGCHNHVQAFNFRSVQEADGADTSGKGLGTDTEVDTNVDTAVDNN